MLPLALLAGGLPLPGLAAGLGVIQLDTTGFLRTSPERATSATSFALGPRLRTEGTWVDAGLDARALGFAGERASVTAEVWDAYIETSRARIPHHQLTLGRKRLDWGSADRVWSLGLWQPRFSWDALRPEPVGLTGAIYSYESRHFRVRLLGSPVSVPERGVPVVEGQGRLTSADPFWIAPYERVALLDRTTELRYRIEAPPTSELIFAPGAALALEAGDARAGPRAALSHGVLPASSLDLAVDAALTPLTGAVDVTVHPRRFHHAVTQLELGWRSGIGEAWGSIARERPWAPSAPATWMTTPVRPAWIGALGGTLRLDGARLALNAATLWIREDPAPPEAPVAGASPLPALELASRFPLRQALRVGARWQATSRWSSELGWTRDLLESASLVSATLAYAVSEDGGWRVEGGGDFFLSSSSGAAAGASAARGQIASRIGDDRFRLRVAYAF